MKLFAKYFKDNSHWIIILFLASAIIAIRFIFSSFWDSIFKKENACDIFLVIGVIVSSLLMGTYIEKIKQNRLRRIPTQIGLDLGSVFSWLFSVNGLFVLLVGSVITVVIYIIKKSGSNNNYNDLQLLTITLTVTLSALIPTMISRIVTKNQLNDIIEQKLDTELIKYKTTLINIRRDKGHSSRMSAVLLEQMAGSKASDDQFHQICQDNAAWSIGWASEAIIQYMLIRDVYNNALKNSAACINVINKAANHITKISVTSGTSETSEIPKTAEKIVSNINLRDLKSVLTMHSLIDKCGLIESLEKEATEQRKQEKVEFNNSKGGLIEYKKYDLKLIELLTIIEDEFYSCFLEKKQDINFSNFCTITGMTEDFNDDLNRYAERIINQMQERNQPKNDR